MGLVINNTAQSTEQTYLFQAQTEFTLTNQGTSPIIFNFDASVVSNGAVSVQPGQTAAGSCTTLHYISTNGTQAFQINVTADYAVTGAVAQVSLTGSNAIESFSPSVPTTEINIPFQKVSRSIWVANDGGADVLAAFNNNTTNPTTAISLNNAVLPSQVTTTGSWAYNGSNPWFGWQTTSAGSYAIFNPGSNIVTQIGDTHAVGTGTGIATVTLSTDGITWQNPSSIAGVTRSDGATSTAMDSIDMYSASTTTANIVYTLPYPAAWRIKYLESNTKNASSTNFTINLQSVQSKAGNTVSTVKAGETKVYSLASGQIRLASTTGQQPVRVDVFE